MEFCGLNPGCTIPPWDLDPPLFATDMGVGVGVRLVLEYLMLEIFLGHTKYHLKFNICVKTQHRFKLSYLAKNIRTWVTE